MARRFEQVAILGTGLIGSSLALALKDTRTPPRVAGFDLSTESRRGAAGLKTTAGVKAFDSLSASLPEAAQQADLVIVSTPVGAMELLFRELAVLAPPDTVIVDTGGTKQQVVAWAEEILPATVQFVGGSPTAGKVAAGPDESDGALFRQSIFCLCPLARTEREAVDAVVKLVEEIGAYPYFVDASEHDGLVAAVSHIPYLASVALVNSVARDRGWRESATLAAGGFANASHLAESEPRMLADICLTNREAIVRNLDRLTDELGALREAIAASDGSLMARFEEAQRHHRDWLSGRAAEGGETREPIDTSSMRPGSLFLPGRLSDLVRGRDKKNQD